MKPILLSGLLLAAALPALAQNRYDAPAPSLPPPMADDLKRAEEAMRRGFENMLESVDILLRAVPQYEMPQFNENGDIIIKRRPPSPAPGEGLRPRRSSDII
jgi:hypothetical protein